MKHRVIQWATGSMGKTCLRAVIDHPDLELAGLFVYSNKKAGRDAGEIAGRAPTGILAVNDIEDILSIDADVVIHTPRIQFPYSKHNQDIIRLLASGKNIISINGHSFPEYHGLEYAAGFDEACRKGNSTFFGTGLNPGFVVEKITAVASGICTKIESINVTEIFDFSGAPDYNYVFQVCGMGSDPETFDLSDSGPVTSLITGMYAEVIALLVHRLGLVLDRVEPDHYITPAHRDIQARAGIVKEGTTAATNWRWHGIVDGRRFITLSVRWIMARDLPGFENDDHWKISIRGIPGIEITMNLVEPEGLEVKTKAEQFGVAGSVINAIPEVCAAPAGLFHPNVFGLHRERF